MTIFFSLKDWEEDKKMIYEKIAVAGTAVLQKGYLNAEAYEKYYKVKIKWYRSRERRSNSYSPFCAYMMNKKWWLEEDFTNHILRFQQVECIKFTIKKNSAHNQYQGSSSCQ